MGTTSEEIENWAGVHPARAKSLSDARLQFHHAAQFASAMGISYLAPRGDDSHTSMSWDRRFEALRSPETRALSHAVRIAVRPRDLTLLVLVNNSVGQRIPLHGNSIAHVESTVRSALNATGLDGRRYTLKRHFSLPPHAVAGGQAFDASRHEDFAELAAWYDGAARVLSDVKNRIGGSDVRCWPHGFDIATLTTTSPGVTLGAGLSPGDRMYPEPYFYVNTNDAPDVTRLPQLDGDGSWNTEGWRGAVLPGSRLCEGAAEQHAQITAFLDSAIAALTNP
jgi:hypothetical protein